jgi:predicted ribosome quality control (RQC) complex YloA/Tae2 family protein
MDNYYLAALLKELTPQIQGKVLRKVAIASDNKAALLLDFHLPEGKWLMASLEPAISAIYLTTCGREQINEAHGFAAQVAKTLHGKSLISVKKPALERIIQLDFGRQQTGEITAQLFLALTGRTANAYLTDASKRVQAMLHNRPVYKMDEPIILPVEKLDIEAINSTLSPLSSEEDLLALPIIQQLLASKQLQKEFHARCIRQPAVSALQSLLRDACEAPPSPRIYATIELDRARDLAIKQKPTILLSHFPLKMVEQQPNARTEISPQPIDKPKDKTLTGKSLSQASTTSTPITSITIHFHIYLFPSLSDAGRSFYRSLATIQTSLREIQSLQRLLDDAVKKQQSLLTHLEEDWQKYRDPERFKQFGDLLLANQSTAKLQPGVAVVVDYYDANQSLLEIPIADDQNLQQAAADYYSQYQKSRRALDKISNRRTTLQKQLHELKLLLSQLKDASLMAQVMQIRERAEILLGIRKSEKTRNSSLHRKTTTPGRWYRSILGYEIIVGKNDRDNEAVTFRLARPHDVWLHAADYPGSHVIILNPKRQEIPIQIILEAAELAAYFSQAKEQQKVAVHYTQKKFVTKPPRAKPGLVRLSSYKTILVEPQCKLEKIAL